VKLNVNFMNLFIVLFFMFFLFITLAVNERTNVETVSSVEIMDHYGRYVKFCGNVVSSKYSEKSKTLFLTIEDERGHVNSVKFQSDVKKIDGYVCVEGEATIYKSKLEIIIRSFSFPHNP